MDFKKFIGKYFGLQQINDAFLSKEKTYLGKDKLVLSFETFDGVSEKKEYPLEVVEHVISDTAMDLTSLRDKRIGPVVEKLIAILVESELVKDDLDHVIRLILPESILQAKKRADKLLWKKEEYDISLLDIEKVLKAK